MAENEASRGNLSFGAFGQSFQENPRSGQQSQSNFRQSLIEASEEDLIYEITYTVPTATVNRLFAVKPNGLVLTPLQATGEYFQEFGLGLTVDSSVPVIVSFFLNVKETTNLTHDIVLDLAVKSEYHPKPLHFQISPVIKEKISTCIVPNTLVVFEKEELDSLKVLSDSRIDDVWPLIIRIQEAEQKDQQVLFLYVKFGQVEGKGNQIQAIIVDQKLELPNPVSPDGLTSFRLSPVFLSSPNSNTPSPCLICLNEVANLVSLPCGHLALGDLCIKTYFEKNDNRLCLVCRQEVKELVSISDSGYDFEKASEHRRQLEKQDEMKQTENNLKSREVSPGIGTRTENILKHGTIISESNNLDGESIIDNNHYIRGKDILKYPLKKDIESNLDDQMSDEENRDKVGSFNPLTFNKSMKKDIDRTSDLQFKGKNIFGSSTAKNSKEKISFENDHKRVKDLEDTGLANRKSEPQLKPKKK